MRAVLLRSTLLLAGLALAGLVLRLAGFDGNLGANGPVSFLAVGALLCAVGAPRQAVAYAGGLAFGFWAGAALALASEVLGAALSFAWARAVARDWARQRIARAFPRIHRISARLAARPFAATLTLRLLPVGNNLALTLLAAVVGLPPIPFLAASALGYIPQTVAFALVGNGVQVARSAQIGLAAALFAASALLGLLLMRRAVDIGVAGA